jgi:nitrous oxidase accessory protein NosD
VHEPQHNPSLFVQEVIALCAQFPAELQTSVVQELPSLEHALPVRALCAQFPAELQTSCVQELPSLEQELPVNAL